MNFGLGIPNLAESGVRMMCKVKISGVSAQTFVLQVRAGTEGDKEVVYLAMQCVMHTLIK